MQRAQHDTAAGEYTKPFGIAEDIDVTLNIDTNDLYQYMKEHEANQVQHPDHSHDSKTFSRSQKHRQWRKLKEDADQRTYLSYRCTLIDWMNHVGRQLHLYRTTIHVSICYLDRMYASKNVVPTTPPLRTSCSNNKSRRNNKQTGVLSLNDLRLKEMSASASAARQTKSQGEWKLLAAACISIAIKHDESENSDEYDNDVIPALIKLVRCEHGNLKRITSRKFYDHGELEVLDRLGWHVRAFPPLRICQYFLCKGVCYENDTWETPQRQLSQHLIQSIVAYVEFFCNMTIQDVAFLRRRYVPTQLAAAILLTVRVELRIQPSWRLELVQLTGYTKDDIQHIHKHIWTCYELKYPHWFHRVWSYDEDRLPPSDTDEAVYAASNKKQQETMGEADVIDLTMPLPSTPEEDTTPSAVVDLTRTTTDATSAELHRCMVAAATAARRKIVGYWRSENNNLLQVTHTTTRLSEDDGAITGEKQPTKKRRFIKKCRHANKRIKSNPFATPPITRPTG